MMLATELWYALLIEDLSGVMVFYAKDKILSIIIKWPVLKWWSKPEYIENATISGNQTDYLFFYTRICPSPIPT